MSSGRLRYGIETEAAGGRTPRMFLDVPNPVLQRLTDSGSQAGELLSLLGSKTKRLFEIDPIDAGTSEPYSRVYVNTRRIGRVTENGLGQYQGSAAAGVVCCLNSISAEANEEERDPRVTIRMPSRGKAETTLGMGAVVSWPQGDDISVGDAVARYMRSVAYDLRYLSSDRSQIEREVGASVSRERGVELWAHQIGSVSLGTEGWRFRAGQETLRLREHNIANEAQRIILLSGVIALANADQLI